MLQLNTASLYNLLRGFYTLTKIHIVLFDSEFRQLLAYPSERDEFCRLLRKDPKGEANCQASDKNGCMQCAKTKDIVIYPCHAGLTEAVVPIIDKNGVLAYVMFGQVIPKESCTASKAKIQKKYPEYAQIIDQIPVKSAEELDAAATVLQAITSYIITNNWVIPGKSGFIRQLDRYIDDHLNQNINIEEITVAFRIGRTRLYELSKEYLGCGLAEYIRNRRIQQSQQLLLQTDTPITDIAYAVGFSDYNHFSRVFKQIVGCSARNYRKCEKS